MARIVRWDARDAAKTLRGAGRGDRRTAGRWRPRAAELTALLDRTGGDAEVLAGVRIFERRSAQLRPHVDRLLKLERRSELTEPVAELAHSLVHMHVNCMVRSQQRTTELVLADWLHRLYVAAERRASR